MADIAEKKLRTYSAEDVAKHNSDEDAWIIIEGKVYNVTDYVQIHPGGDEVLLNMAGRDATREFDEVNHSDGAKKQLESFIIGTLQTTPAPLEDTIESPKDREYKSSISLITQISDWFGANSDRVSQIAAASATILLAAYIAKRYIATAS